MTKAQSRYPPALCEALARAVGDALTERACERPRDEAAPQQKTWVKEKPPTAAPCWDVLSRWGELFRVAWARLEHNNIGELRIAVMAMKRLARARHNWGKRFLMFSDSMVTIGVLTKGRSSSWPLLRLAREAAAYQLVLRIRPYWRYIETQRNIADGPSRGFGIGHAPPWASLREKELDRVLRLRLQLNRERPAPRSIR